MARDRYGSFTMNRTQAGCLLAFMGWLLLAASLFLPRADDYFREVAGNTFIEYQPAGAVLMVVLLVLLPVMVRALRGRPRSAGILGMLFLIASAVSIYSAFHIGTWQVPFEDFREPNEIGAGSILAIIASLMGFLGAGLAAGPGPDRLSRFRGCGRRRSGRVLSPSGRGGAARPG